MSSPLVSLSEQLVSTVESVGRFTVAVHARSRFDSSGVHWNPGIIVTAEHAIRRDDDILITTSKGMTLKADLVGRDPGTDLALLRVADIDIPVAARNQQPALQPGSVVLAVGRSKESAIAGFGVISGISGPSQTRRGGRLDQVVRLDLSLHPGAAGGAVVDAAGNLIGIATPALSRVSIFAIPLSTVDRVTGKLLAHGRMPRGYLGIGFHPVAIPEHLVTKLNLPASTALMAVSVDADGPAGRAGAILGDVLLELGGKVTAEPEDVQQVLDADSIGKKLSARVLRGGNIGELEITVGERPRRG